MKSDPLPLESPTSHPVPLSHPYRVGGTWDRAGGLVPWDSRGTPWDGGMILPRYFGQSGDGIFSH